MNSNIRGNNNLGKFRKIIVAEMSRREGKSVRGGLEGREDLDKNLTEGHASELTELPLLSIIYYWCTEAYIL